MCKSFCSCYLNGKTCFVLERIHLKHSIACRRRRPYAGQNTGGMLMSKIQGVWEIYTQFPIAAEIQPVFLIADKGA